MIKIIVIIWACLFYVPWLLIPAAQANCVQEVEFSGTIVEAGSELPIPGALVCVQDFCIPPSCMVGPIACGLCTITDSSGAFNITVTCDEIPTGAYVHYWFYIDVSKDGYVSQTWDEGKTYPTWQPICGGSPFEWQIKFNTLHLQKEPAGILETGDGLPPSAFELQQNYPNPFNLGTTIGFTLTEPAVVELTIYDILGRIIKVRNLGHYQPGMHTSHFDSRDRNGRPLPSGVYFYRIAAGDISLSRRMVLLK